MIPTKNEKSHQKISWIPFKSWASLLSKKSSQFSNLACFLQIIFFWSKFNSNADEEHRLQLRENCSKISLMAFKESHRKTESRLSLSSWDWSFEKHSLEHALQFSFRALQWSPFFFRVLFQLHTVPKLYFWSKKFSSKLWCLDFQSNKLMRDLIFLKIRFMNKNLTFGTVFMPISI